MILYTELEIIFEYNSTAEEEDEVVGKKYLYISVCEAFLPSFSM